MYLEKVKEIKNTIDDYFYGVFDGNIKRLERAFHKDAILYGDINDEPYLKTLTEYLEVVKNRKSPRDLGEEFRMEILYIDILGNNAITKLYVPLLGYNYFDFLSLKKIDGRWLIVNKLFANT